MDFSGPEPADFANVGSLNVAFLSILRDSMTGAELRQFLPADSQPAVIALNDLQLTQLADVPFLLMSLRENETVIWRQLTSVEPTGDLLQHEPVGDALDRLLAAGLGFLWQLARRNPYAARLVSGATLDWCERLAEATLFHLLQNAAVQRDLLIPRFAGQKDIWNKLLGAGVSPEPDVRNAAQLSALQFMLTTGQTSQYQNVRAAACSAPVPVFRIAEKPDDH
jgi:hypothetical protein